MMPRVSVVRARITAAVVIKLKNSQVAYVQRNVAARNIAAQPPITYRAMPKKMSMRFLNSWRTEIQPCYVVQVR